MTIEEIKEQITALSPQERADVAHFTLLSLDHDTNGDVDEQAIEEAWRQELDRRTDDILSGKATGIPAKEVHQRLREKLQ